MTSIESPPRAAGCPDLEDIAAFLDGTLDEAERQRVLEHLAHCKDCYEIFAGAALFLDSEAEPQDEQEGKVVPFSLRRLLSWSALAAAAVLLIALGFLLYRSFLARPSLQTAELISPAVASRTADRVWTGPVMRGPAEGSEEESLEIYRERAFQLGVQVTNLWVRLQAENRDLAGESTKALLSLLRKEDLADDIRDTYEKQILQGIANEEPLMAIEGKAQEAEAALRQRLQARSTHFDFGKWTAAGFLAATAQEAAFFERPENRRFARWIARQSGQGIDPKALAEVDAIREVLKRSPLAEAEYEELRERFENILKIYYNYSRLDA